MPPFCGEEEFGEVLETIVVESAPRLFAVVQEYGTRVGVRVAGWGLAHEDHVDVIGMESDAYLGVSRPEDVLRDFGVRDRVTARIVWHDPAGDTTPTVCDDAPCRCGVTLRPST